MERKRREADASPKQVSECSLPGHKPRMPFSSIAAFEAHYYTEHAFRCLAPLPLNSHDSKQAAPQLVDARAHRCGKTFPNEHFLALHMDECHSSLTAQRRERGEKVVRPSS